MLLLIFFSILYCKKRKGASNDEKKLPTSQNIFPFSHHRNNKFYQIGNISRGNVDFWWAERNYKTSRRQTSVTDVVQEVCIFVRKRRSKNIKKKLTEGIGLFFYRIFLPMKKQHWQGCSLLLVIKQITRVTKRSVSGQHHGSSTMTSAKKHRVAFTSFFFFYVFFFEYVWSLIRWKIKWREWGERGEGVGKQRRKFH